jgi:hypothetical protein
MASSRPLTVMGPVPAAPRPTPRKFGDTTVSKMMSNAQHARQGYETCGCGRPQCRKRRIDDRRTQRRVEKDSLRKELGRDECR